MAEGKKDRGFKLGDISPLAGLATGEGLTGTVLGGLAPMAIRKLMDRGKDEEEEMVAVKKGPGMKSGGKVGSSCMKRGGKVGGVMKGGDMPFFASKSKEKMASKRKPARSPKTNYASGGMVRGDGCAMRGKTKGKNC
jgi:hypothetical protein